MIRSPFSDVEIPNRPLTEFVLARAGEFGHAPALIDAPTGHTIAYGELVESVRAVATGLAERGFGRAMCSRTTPRTVPSTRLRSTRSQPSVG